MSEITLHKSDDFADVEAIHDALYSYNLSRTGTQRMEVHAENIPGMQSIVARNEAGELLGGIVYYKKNKPVIHLHAEYLFLSEACRGKGTGYALMNALKQEAARRRLGKIILTTNDYQAPGFYMKNGFFMTRRKPSPQPLMPENNSYTFEYNLTKEELK